jgi:hypothetical protein
LKPLGLGDVVDVPVGDGFYVPIGVDYEGGVAADQVVEPSVGGRLAGWR